MLFSLNDNNDGITNDDDVTDNDDDVPDNDDVTTTVFSTGLGKDDDPIWSWRVVGGSSLHNTTVEVFTNKKSHLHIR
jgi:hypothetical protein